MKLRKLAWILPLLFCCCNKQDSTPVTRIDNGFSFTTNYDSVYTCYPFSNITLSFTITVNSGDIISNPVTYSITGLPPGITATPVKQTVGGVMGGAFTIALGDIPPGNDTANFIISDSTTGTETHQLIFEVKPPVDYAPKLAGTYHGSYDFCEPDSIIPYTSTVSAVVDTPYLVRISNIKNLGAAYSVRAWLTHIMGANTITIPQQALGPYTIWGSGTFSHDVAPYDTLYQMIIHDTLAQGTDTEYCTIHIQH